MLYSAQPATVSLPFHHATVPSFRNKLISFGRPFATISNYTLINNTLNSTEQIKRPKDMSLYETKNLIRQNKPPLRPAEEGEALYAKENRQADIYPKGKLNKLREWITDLHEKSKTSDVLAMPTRTSQRTLISNKNFRIDCQGYFKVNEDDRCGWINLQVQENVSRSKGESTTVLTTYVHWEGFHTAEMIKSRTILKAMKQQVYNFIPEITLFVWVNKNNGVAVQNVLRSPYGVLEHGTPWNIWVPKLST